MEESSRTKEELKEAPIGVFDSGLGGISVLREMVKEMPHEDFLYLGDSLHAPYGTKALAEVKELTYRSFDYMHRQGVKAVAIACNTATSAAVASLRKDYPLVPLIGIEPAVKPAALSKKNARVLVLATPMTLSLEKFHHLEERFEDQAVIIPVACPGLMEFVEQGILEGPELEDYLKEKLSSAGPEPPDAIVLGCTHYPFVRKAIRRVAGEGVRIFDGGAGCARELHRRIREADLCSTRSGPGRVEFVNTLDTEEMHRLAVRLFELPEL